jgi:ABC-2 type transport system ATP-binding protein
LREVEDLCDRVIIIQKGEIKTEVVLRGAEEKECPRRFSPEQTAVGTAIRRLRQPAECRGRLFLLFPQDIPALNRALVGQDFLVYSIMPYAESLEDEFMKVIMRLFG